MKRTFAIYSGLLLLFNNIYGQNSFFTDSIFQQVQSGRLTAYDTSFNPISQETFAVMFSMYDTAQNDQWTRPKFVDNIYHPSIDGVVLKSKHSFDTATFNSGFIAFKSFNFDKKGNLINSERPIAFLIERNYKYRNPDSVKAAEYQKMLRRPESLEKYNLLKNTSWKNSAITINNVPYIFDSCQYKFKLEFGADLTFIQSYEGKLSCLTIDMYPDIAVGIEGGGSEFHKFNNKLQGCFIENPNGIWFIEKEDLILKTIYGKEITRFRIINIESKKMKLWNGTYTVELIKSN